MFASDTWRALISNVKDRNTTLHFLGLFSDGNVHSHIDHLFALMQMAKDRGLERVYIHAFLDGRDVSPTSGADYVTRTVEKCRELGSSVQPSRNTPAPRVIICSTTVKRSAR